MLHIYIQPHWSKVITLYTILELTKRLPPISVRQHAGPLLRLNLLQVSLCLLWCTVASVLSFVHLNVRYDIQIVLVVDEIHDCLCFILLGCSLDLKYLAWNLKFCHEFLMILIYEPGA